jgi:hypothetical protein
VQNEKGFLASRLGLDDASKDSPAVAARQMKKGKIPVKEEKEPNYDVPYFSKFLLPPPPHYTRGGMHAATAQAEQARKAAGLVDDDGVHYVGKESGEKLAKELKDEERAYLFSENHGIVWQSAAERKKFEDEAMTAAARKKFAQEQMQNPLDRKQDKVLARRLEAGIAYASLPNHGVPVEERKDAADAAKSKDAGVVTGAAGKKLAEELEAGEQQALAFEAAQANREEEVNMARSQVGAPRVRAVRGAKLAKEQAAEEKLAHELLEGQREALLASSQKSAYSRSLLPLWRPLLTLVWYAQAPFGYNQNDNKSEGAKRLKLSQGSVAPRIMAVYLWVGGCGGRERERMCDQYICNIYRLHAYFGVRLNAGANLCLSVAHDNDLPFHEPLPLSFSHPHSSLFSSLSPLPFNCLPLPFSLSSLALSPSLPPPTLFPSLPLSSVSLPSLSSPSLHKELADKLRKHGIVDRAPIPRFYMDLESSDVTEEKEEAEKGGLWVDSGEELARQWGETQEGSWKGQGEGVEDDEENGDFLGVSAE